MPKQGADGVGVVLLPAPTPCGRHHGPWAITRTPPPRVWHHLHGEGVVLAVKCWDDEATEYAVDFHFRGRKHVVEPWARLRWLDPLGALTPIDGDVP